ncbi:MAG TPA: YdcF family protein [Vicinamibacterales bacterium]|nr:YdcF family protein [Vicinamibacterales bacterium]
MKRFLRRSAIVLAPVLLIGIVALRGLGSWLVVQDPLAKADAIFVLGGTRFERPLEAVELYKAGWAPRIALMRQVSDYGEVHLMQQGIPYPREVDAQVDVMVRLGVPQSAITIFNEANSTAEEADTLYEAATANHWSSVIIVTSKQHTRRARLVMTRRTAPIGLTVVTRYSRYDQADTDRWWTNRSVLRFTLFETQRLFGYWIGVAD